MKERERATITRTMRDLIYGEAIRKPKIPRQVLAVQLRDTIEETMGAITLPTEDTIQRMISRARNHTSPLNQTWSIGVCEKHNIPADIIPRLIEYRRDISEVETPEGRLDLSKSRLSIRKARWMASLWPQVNNLTSKLCPHEPLRQIGIWSRIADIYSDFEQIAELEKDYPGYFDTFNLDRLIFVTEHPSIDSLNDALFEAIWLKNTKEDVEYLMDVIIPKIHEQNKKDGEK